MMRSPSRVPPTRLLLGAASRTLRSIISPMRLSPLDPNIIGMQGGTAFAHFIAGRYDEASSWAEKALWQQANHLTLLIVATASHALGGRAAEARQTLAHLCDYACLTSQTARRLGGWK